jgi:uncharacterized protein
VIRVCALALAVLFVSGTAGLAAPPDAAASHKVQDCIKTAAAGPERCIGLVSGPCLEDDKTKSTADMNACIDREVAVWDDILNESFRRLREKLDETQRVKLRDMQRAWIASRARSCGF